MRLRRAPLTDKSMLSSFRLCLFLFGGELRSLLYDSCVNYYLSLCWAKTSYYCWFYFYFYLTASATSAAAYCAFLAFYYSLINWSFLIFSSSCYRYLFDSMSLFCCWSISCRLTLDSTFGEGCGAGIGAAPAGGGSCGRYYI